MRGKIVYSRDGTSCVCTVEGKVVSREEFDLAFPPREIGEPLASHTSSCWPMLSDALAVHPDQIEEAMADSRKKGVPTEFDGEGRAILTDRGHRRDYMRAYKFHDRHAGYGD